MDLLKIKNSQLTQFPTNFNSIEEYTSFHQTIVNSCILNQTTPLISTLNGNSISLAKNMLEHLEIRRLRYEVFDEEGLSKQFVPKVEGYDFDTYDGNSYHIQIKNKDDTLTGGMRLILDSSNIKLQSDPYYSFDDLRNQGLTLAEMSRLVISSEHRGRLDSFNLVSFAYKLGRELNIDRFVFGIRKKHLNFYKRLAETQVHYEGTYGNIDDECVIASSSLKDIDSKLEKKLLEFNFETEKKMVA